MSRLRGQALPLKPHLFASQDPIQIHHLKSARVGCAEWGIHYTRYSSRLLASARVNTSPVPCPHLTLIAQVSRVTRNVYSRPDTHSVSSILARAPGILCPGYFYKASLLWDKRDTGDFSTSPNKLNWHRSCGLEGPWRYHRTFGCRQPLLSLAMLLLSPNCVLSL